MTHPITPPPDLLKQWHNAWFETDRKVSKPTYIAHYAAQWGADQELEACCEWLVSEGWFKYEHEAVEELRAARRPKPPSLKEQALDAHNRMMAGTETQDDWTIIRCALEQLDD